MTNPFSTVGRAWREFGDDHCSLLAAAISYHVLFAIIPVMTLLLAILGMFVRDPASQQAMTDRVMQLLPFQFGQGSGDLVLGSLRGISNQTQTLTIIGVLGLIWSSAGIFGTLRSALDIAWDVTSKRSFIADTLLNIGALIGLAVLFALSLGGTIFVSMLQTPGALSIPLVSGLSPTALTVLGYALPAVFTFIAFLMLYRYIPDVHHGVGDVVGGALFATVLFEALKVGFAWYVAHLSRYQSLYGALGGVMLFMLWTYLSALIMLFGAEIAAETEHAHTRPTASETPALMPTQTAI